jgi:hypothetical protein
MKIRAATGSSPIKCAEDTGPFGIVEARAASARTLDPGQGIEEAA